MKCIFLHIDGVLNTGDHLQVSYELWKIRHEGYEHDDSVPKERLYDGLYMDQYGEVFDPRAVKWLHFLLASTDAKLIIAASWKGNRKVGDMWKHRTLPGSVYEITPNVNSDNPAIEIGMWIEDNKEDIESFVVIDAFDRYP